MITYAHALNRLQEHAAELPSLYPRACPDYRGRTVDAATVRDYLVMEGPRFAEAAAMLPAPPRPGARALEVGIAYGFLAALVKSNGWEAEGLELEENIPVYCAFARRHGIPVHSGRLGVAPLPFPGGSYDAVIFSEVLEHLRLSPGLVFRELHRLLAPGGWLLVSTPNHARLANVLKLLAGRSVVEAFPEDAACENATELLTHVREYTMREMKRLLAAARFEVRRARYSACMEQRKPRRFLTALIPPWRGNLMLLAQKGA